MKVPSEAQPGPSVPSPSILPQFSLLLLLTPLKELWTEVLRGHEKGGENPGTLVLHSGNVIHVS